MCMHVGLQRKLCLLEKQTEECIRVVLNLVIKKGSDRYCRFKTYTLCLSNGYLLSGGY